MRNLLLIALGMIIMYFILTVIAGKNTSQSESWAMVKKLIATQQFNNLMRTNEFREIVKTKEFQNVIATLAADQVQTVAKTLVG